MKGKKKQSIGALIVALLFALVVSIFPMMSALALEGDVEINETNFPDAIFREYVESFDTDETKGVLSQAERDAVTKISVQNKGISDLKGVEFFTNLESLRCNNNSLTELDVSANTALNALFCYNNQLTGLDVSNNLNLQELGCDYNKITELNVTQNTALEYLSFSSNLLDNLDVSKNLALTALYCTNNNLTSLNVTKNTALTTLFCAQNKITELDVTQNTDLENFQCDINQLLTLDVTQNKSLKELDCSNNKLTTLDVSQNTKLESLQCHYNPLGELNVRQNPALKTLRCMANNLTVLDVSQNPALEKLECFYNQLTNLDVSANSKLATFDAKSQTYNIEVDKDILSFDLSSLPGNFNPARAHDWVGATATGSTVTADASKPAKITYKYDAVDNDKTFDVTLNVTYIDTGMKKVTVSFDTNGGTGTMDDKVVIKDGNYTLPENTFTAPAGKEFKAWLVGDAEKAAGDVITVNADTTVKAVWKDKPVEQVTVSFDANGGTGTMDGATVNKGSDYTLPENTFTAPAGKEFKAWLVGDAEKAAGDVITVNADTTVKAVWKDKAVEQVTVSFDANGGRGNMDSKTVNKGSDYTLPDNDFIPPAGKDFDAWDVDGEERYEGEVITVNANTTVKAVWKDKPDEQAIISFDANGGTGVMWDVGVVKGSYYELPESEFTAPDGKEFDAWEVRGKRQDVGAEILADSDFTVKALWKDKKVAPPADTKPEQQEPVKPNKPQTKPAKPNAKTGVNNMLSLASASTLLVTIGGTLFISKNRRKNNQ